MAEHGQTWAHNAPGPRTLCKCGREFNTDQGFYVHLGKMQKLSNMIAEKKDVSQQ
jgi:hypothetical protein